MTKTCAACGRYINESQSTIRCHHCLKHDPILKQRRKIRKELREKLKGWDICSRCRSVAISKHWINPRTGKIYINCPNCQIQNLVRHAIARGEIPK